jgi:hypothetical protein
VRRLTTVKIKPGTINKIVEIANGAALQDVLKSYPHLLSMKVYHAIAEDKSETVMAISVFPDKASEEGARPKIAEALGTMKEHLAGAPDSAFGPEMWVFRGSGTSDKVVRIGNIPMKAGFVAPTTEILNSEDMKTLMEKEVYKKANFEAVAFDASDTSMVSLSFWPDQAAMEAAQGTFNEAVGKAKDYLDGTPTTRVAEKVWEFTRA